MLPSALFAADFGFAVNFSGGYGNPAIEENKYDYKIDFLPRLSFLIGDNGEFSALAGFTVGYEEYFYYVPEIMQAELTMRLKGSGIIRLGRMGYSDPLSFIAEGLFDGAQFIYNSGAGSFRIGAWYTGFLYKKNINITMTENDLAGFNAVIDYDKFADTYFAPKRMFASIGWEHYSVGELVHLNTAIIGQYDLNDADKKYNSQYLIVKAGIPVSKFLFELGGCLETLQKSDADKDEFDLAFAAEAGISLLFSGERNSMLSFNGKIAGGKIEDTCDAFVPITVKYYGFVFKHKLSAISIFSLNYSSRLHDTAGVSLNMLYFIRNDLGTVQGYPVTDNEGYFLGPEFSAQVIWSPASDLQLNLRGGLFVPQLGDAGSQEKIMWRAELSAAISLY